MADGRKRPLEDTFPRGPMHHRHTVGLDILCQVARLQSLTPLLQAAGVKPPSRDSNKASGHQRFTFGKQS